MLRILLIIVVALAVIFGLMRLTGAKPSDVGAATEGGAATAGQGIGETAPAVGAATEDALGAAADAAGDVLDATSAADEVVDDVLEDPAAETDAPAEEPAPAAEPAPEQPND